MERGVVGFGNHPPFVIQDADDRIEPRLRTPRRNLERQLLAGFDIERILIRFTRCIDASGDHGGNGKRLGHRHGTCR